MKKRSADGKSPTGKEINLTTGPICFICSLHLMEQRTCTCRQCSILPKGSNKAANESQENNDKFGIGTSIIAKLRSILVQKARNWLDIVG